MTEMMQTNKVLAALDGGSVSFSDLLRTVAVRENVTASIPVDLPKQIVVTAAQSAALANAERIVNSGVTPVERRRLSQEELASLMEERETLDAISKMIEDRREAQRAAIFNHFDVEAEATGMVGERDKKGHLLEKAEAVVASAGKKFTREVRRSAPSLDADALAALVDDAESDFSHDDFLACTTQVRVLDEAKVLMHLRKRPEVINALAKATSEGAASASLFVRKA